MPFHFCQLVQYTRKELGLLRCQQVVEVNATYQVSHAGIYVVLKLNTVVYI